VPDPVEPSPLTAVPALATVGELLADPVVVTDLHRRVVLWNRAAEALYGIPSRDALGVPIEDLFTSLIVGEGTSSAGARIITLDTGSWRGRVADTPLIGRLVGQERIVESVLSRVDGPDGQPVGVLSVKRDVTPSVRVERELAALGELASASGETRSRVAAASRALDVLASSLGAMSGAIALADGPNNRVVARYNVDQAIADAVSSVPWSESPAIRGVAKVGRVLKGPLDRLPLAPQNRQLIASTGARSLVLVGLHRQDELIGVLVLTWAETDPALPSDAAILLVASHVARSLENARLIEEILRRVEAERAMGARLRALEELTRVGSHVTTMAQLAERSAQLINAALGAAGTAYGLVGPDGDAWEVSHFTDLHPAIEAWLRRARPDVRSAFRRWRAGEGAFLEQLEPGVVPMDIVELARSAGLTAYAAIPIRVEDQVVGGIAAYFDRPVGELFLDRGALDRIATVASIAVENFRLRERLQASEERYRTLFAKAPDALLVTLPDQTVIDANDAATDLFDADREWLIGRAAPELCRLDPIAAGARPAPTARVSRGTGTRRDGTTFPLELEATSIESDGEPRRLLRVRDLTDQDRLQAELIQAQKMEATGQLVSGVAHELNNPLAAILGFSQLIRQDPNLPDDLRANADLLVEEASRTRRIVQNLLDFARQRPPERYPTSIKALVDSVLTLQSYTIGTGQIALELEIPDDLPIVALDRGQLQQVLINLTHNAVYAITHGGGSRIRISAVTERGSDGPRVRITVMDDGPGVAPADVEHLFDAFFTTKPPSDGTGLGLPVSAGIIRSHGGELRYVPSALGRGAAFTFDLPVRGAHEEPGPHADADAVESAGSAAVAGMRSGATVGDAPAPGASVADERPLILVVDDEPSIRALIMRALPAMGYESVSAESGEQALAIVADRPVQAVLCDHQMAGMSGVAVYDAVIAARPDLRGRFVMMSGDVQNPDLAAFTASHDIKVLSKPFQLDDLRDIAAAVTGAAASGQSRG
jgi:PAS domain S-box-containing protein